MKYINEMTLNFKSLSINEGFARSAVAAFCVQLNPTLDEITDIKTAVSEAVTNCVVHAYPRSPGNVEIWVGLSSDTIFISISDHGIGIVNFERAREPFYTTKPEQERSGMGFTVMESFMDTIDLSKTERGGTTVTMTKRVGNTQQKALGGFNA